MVSKGVIQSGLVGIANVSTNLKTVSQTQLKGMERREHYPMFIPGNKAVCCDSAMEYPLVNQQNTMENHHFEWENSL